MKTARHLTLLLPVLAGCTMAGAAEELSEGEMEAVSGQDGISITASLPATASINSLIWHVDEGVTSVGGVAVTPEIFAIAKNLSFAPVNADGTAPAAGTRTTLNFDSNFSAGPRLKLEGSWDRMRMQIGGYGNETVTTMGSNPTLNKSTGVLAFDSGGGTLTGRTYANGNFSFLRNYATGTTDFALNIVDASLYFRQGAAGTPEMLFDNLRFSPNFTGGNFGIDASGIVITAPAFNFNLTFDLRYEGAPAAASAFTYNAANDRPMLYYGWQGTLTNFETRIKPGGVWYGTTGTPAVYNTANRSEGLNFSARWNYDPTFAWVVGESNPAGSGNPRVQVQFDQWQKIGTGYAFDVPNNTFDIVKAGQGPGGLCWGSRISAAGPGCSDASYASSPHYASPQFLNVDTENGVALIARDAKQMAYSTRVVILDDFGDGAGGASDGDYNDVDPATVATTPNIAPGTAETQNVQWGLIYTLGDFDANIFFYPGGYNFATNAETATGLKTDFLIMTQSHDGTDADTEPDFTTGSHYMIADTGTSPNYGIGFMNSAVLLTAQDMYVSLLPGGLNFRTHPATGLARVHFKGRFGGGDVPTMAKPVKGFDINANFESSNFSFTLEPPPSGQNFLGFSGFVDLGDLDTANFAESTAADTTANEMNDDDGTFISLAEPGRPQVDFRLARISGRMQWTNGMLDMVSDSESAASRANLTVSSVINLGTTGGGNPLTVGRVEFGDKSLGQIVVPYGILDSSISLQRQ
ncbi:MAG: hypothetical protein K0R03_189 [Moraxellaceae bacterium]|jgi:hypothetical protein|nr:hypothetical protein [Moraxellaceae bacterium]